VTLPGESVTRVSHKYPTSSELRGENFTRVIRALSVNQQRRERSWWKRTREAPVKAAVIFPSVRASHALRGQGYTGEKGWWRLWRKKRFGRGRGKRGQKDRTWKKRASQVFGAASHRALTKFILSGRLGTWAKKVQVHGRTILGSGIRASGG